MADSQVILELVFLRIRGGCSLTVLLFFLKLVGTCFILSVSLCAVRPTYRAIEIGNDIFQDLKSFGIERFFNMAMEKF